jgi:hypothetical protein
MALPDGSGNSPRTESSLSTHVLHYVKRIRLAARVRPNCLACCCTKPGDTAPSSDFGALSAHLSVYAMLSRADGQYSRENIPGSRLGL